MEELQTISTLQGVEIALRKELEHIAEGYIKVGYLLKKTRDAEFYKEKGYADVFEFAKETFNISRTWAIRFMQINDTYSIDGNSPEIQEKYRGYGSSKLSEMLALPEEVREVVPRDATVREIREVKEVIRETEDRYSPQMSLCDIAQEEHHGSWTETLVYEFFKGEGKGCFEKMHKWIWEDEPKEESVINKEIMGIVAPTKFRMFRMQFANALFSEFQIRIMPYNGRGEPEEISYLELAKTFEQTFYPEGRKMSDSKAYEEVYQMPLREKKEREVLKTEPLKKKKEPAKPKETLEEPKEPEEQIPGQMEVEDYPELMPDAQVINLPEEEKQVHEITEEVVQEGEVIEDILKSGDPEKIIQLLKKEFAWPKGGWDNWKKKVITL